MEIREGWNIVEGPVVAQLAEGFSRWVEIRRALVIQAYPHSVGMDLDQAHWGYAVTVRYGPDWADWWLGWSLDDHPWDVFEGGWFQPAPEHVAAGFPAADSEVIAYLQELGLELLEAAEEGREVVL